MKKYLYSKTIWAIVSIIIFFGILYCIKLATIPTNFTGDESTYAGFVYKILFGKQFVNPFQILEDTKPATNFYWMAIWVFIFSIKNTVFAMRFSIVLIAIANLVIFYIFLKEYVKNFIAYITTVLLGTSVWYINFARSSWFNFASVFFGLCLFYFFIKGEKEHKIVYFLLAGIFGIFCFYSYLSGYLYPIVVGLYCVFNLIFHFSKKRFRQYSVVLTTIVVGLMPLVYSIFFLPNTFLLRPTSVYIFSGKELWPFIDQVELLSSQIKDVGQGLVLLEAPTIGKGFENIRYVPYHMPVVDPVIRLLFFSGIVLLFFPGISISVLLILLYILTLVTVGILTVDAPNLARTLPVLPCIYYVSAISLSKLFDFLRKKISQKIVYCIFLLSTIILAIINIYFYFQWIQSPFVTQARQPAINYSEFYKWQRYQIFLVKHGFNPINNYQWYTIRGKIKNGFYGNN